MEVKVREDLFDGILDIGSAYGRLKIATLYIQYTCLSNSIIQKSLEDMFHYQIQNLSCFYNYCFLYTQNSKTPSLYRMIGKVYRKKRTMQ